MVTVGGGEGASGSQSDGRGSIDQLIEGWGGVDGNDVYDRFKLRRTNAMRLRYCAGLRCIRRERRAMRSHSLYISARSARMKVPAVCPDLG